jgi:hypothetical protein
MLEELKGLSERRAKAIEAFQAEAKKLIEPTLKNFMQEHKTVQSIRWRQYTPYFNDGEPCEFSVHDIEALAAGGEEDEDGEWDYLYGEPKDGYDADDWKALRELNKTLCGMEDELEAVFGDHVQVIVTKKGVEVEEYDHD